MIKNLARKCVSAATLLLAMGAHAQSFPAKPLRIIVTAVAGSAPDVREVAMMTGTEVIGGRPEDFAAFIRAEIAKWGKLIREAGIKPIWANRMRRTVEWRSPFG